MSREVENLNPDVNQLGFQADQVTRTRIQRMASTARDSSVRWARVGVAAAAIFGGVASPRDQAVSQGIDPREQSMSQDIDCPPIPPAPIYEITTPASADSVGGVSEVSTFLTEIKKMSPEHAVMAYGVFKETVNEYLDFEKDAQFWAQFDGYTPEELSDRFEFTMSPDGSGAKWKFKPDTDPQVVPPVQISMSWGEFGVDSFSFTASRGEPNGDIFSRKMCADTLYPSLVAPFNPGDEIQDLDEIDRMPIKASVSDTQWRMMDPLYLNDMFIPQKLRISRDRGIEISHLVQATGETSVIVMKPETRRLNDLRR